MALKIRKAIISVSDKSELKNLAQAMVNTGTILYASGGSRTFLESEGISCRSVEEITQAPEAFQGRMKTLAFPLFSGILSRRGDANDLKDLERLKISEIDAVVVNFYPFEKASPTASKKELIELIDIGGPSMVRAAAKNSDSVLVLTDPTQYSKVCAELSANGAVSSDLLKECALTTWKRVFEYDQAIVNRLNGSLSKELRYGENPHQKAKLECDADSPVDWMNPLTSSELSFNNISDMSAAYVLGRELKSLLPKHATVVIIKHGNPSGVACVPTAHKDALAEALKLAWAGDPVSAFGGVLLFSEPLTEACVDFLKSRFIDSVLVAEKSQATIQFLNSKKGVKAVHIKKWDLSKSEIKRTSIPGGTLTQSADVGVNENLEAKTGTIWPDSKVKLARFGIAVTRSLKSNAIGVVYSQDGEVFQLVGAGQGQPNRVDALSKLALPRALETLSGDRTKLSECVLVSDAFFPFKDSITAAAEFGIRWICEPGGSVRDNEVIEEAKSKNVSLAFTGVRHFLH